MLKDKLDYILQIRAVRVQKQGKCGPRVEFANTLFSSVVENLCNINVRFNLFAVNLPLQLNLVEPWAVVSLQGRQYLPGRASYSHKMSAHSRSVAFIGWL